MITPLTSLANPRVKAAVKLRQRGHRDDAGLMLIEGYREIHRALEHDYRPTQLFYCEDLWLKHENEPALVDRCRALGADLFPCSKPVFEKLAYRERPDGLLAVGPQIAKRLQDLTLPPDALLLVCEAIEKPGNLGTMLRSADASGAAAVIVCDPCTDIHNPNVVRASTGTLFTLPVAQTTAEELLPWLRANGFSILAATPHADVRIPMLGVADSLNVSAAATILLAEAVRQRILAGTVTPPPPEPWHGHTHDQ